LKKDTSRIITKADKGNCFVVLDRQSYDEKIETLLSDNRTYEKIKKPPFKSLEDLERKLNERLLDLKQQASKRLYALRILKRSGAPANDLITVFCAFIRSVLEYASPVWHFSLPEFLADQIESIQKRVLKIAFLQSSYAASLRNVGLLTLYQRRESQCLSFYKNIHQHSDDKLRTLRPSAISHKFSLRNKPAHLSYVQVQN
jgi:hypothetical protein